MEWVFKEQYKIIWLSFFFMLKKKKGKPNFSDNKIFPKLIFSHEIFGFVEKCKAVKVKFNFDTSN